MKMEEIGTIKKLRTTLIDGLVELLECWINYKKFSNPDLAPPFTNKEGAEELLVEYFTDAADFSIFTYLHTERVDFLTQIITPRLERITYTTDPNITEELLEKTADFKTIVKQNCYPTIHHFTTQLFDQYTKKCNEEKASRRTEALIKTKIPPPSPPQLLKP